MEQALTVTDRQFVCLYLYYREGHSQRRIAGALGVKQQTVHKMIVRGTRWILDESCDPDAAVTSPLIRGLMCPSPTTSTTGHVGRAASRQAELWDMLELRMQHRAKELADIEECMSCSSDLPTRRNGVGHGGVSIGPSGTSWPAEKWEPPSADGRGYGRAVTLPCDD